MEEASVQDEKQWRIRQRLDACRVGLQQLDLLRSKHQRLMQTMRSHLGGTEFSQEKSPAPTESVRSSVAMRSCSPAPSFDLASVISHRSSISMDSGCVSLVSDRSQASYKSRVSHTRKFSKDELRAPDDTGMSDDEGISDPHQLLETAIESTTTVRAWEPRHCPQSNGYVPTRPKSVCSHNYPEENTVVVDSLPIAIPRARPLHWSPPRIARSESVQFAPAHCALPVETDPTYRASRIFIDPERQLSRPKSIALYPSPPERQTTWEDVKRMLDPMFDERKPRTQLNRQMSNASSTLTLTPMTPTQSRKFKLIKASATVTGSRIFVASGQHESLNRSMSSQSSESSKRKEKDWHESEEL